MATQSAPPQNKRQHDGPALQKAPEKIDHQSAARALPHAIGPEKSLLSSMFQMLDLSFYKNPNLIEK
jgi:hypothetical protein